MPAALTAIDHPLHTSPTLKWLQSSDIFGLIFVLVSEAPSLPRKGDHVDCKTSHFSNTCSIMDVELNLVKNRRLICEGEGIPIDV